MDSTPSVSSLLNSFGWKRQAAEAGKPKKEPILKERRDQIQKRQKKNAEAARQPAKVKAQSRQKAEETQQHLGNALDALKQINAILGDKGQIGGEIDARKWEQIKPLLKLAWNEMLAAGKSAQEFVALSIKTLSPAGRPYFEKFVREEVSNESVRGATEGLPDGKSQGSVQADEGGRGTERVPEAESASSDGPETRDGGIGDAGQPGRRDSGKRDAPSLTDYRITEADGLGRGGPKKKFRDNIAAISLLSELKDRQATAQEQAVLAKYVGWGGLAQAFVRPDGTVAKGWEAEAAELKSLLSSADYAAARSTTQDAHYTSEPVIRGIYDALKRIGFKGGKVLEPSIGTGNFVGLMPQTMQARSKLPAAEQFENWVMEEVLPQIRKNE